MKTTSTQISISQTRSFLSDFLELTKFRLAISVMFSSLAGYVLAAEIYDLTTLLLLWVGGYGMVGASNAFNQILEAEFDAQMKRTQNRPIPTGRMSKATALLIGTALTIMGSLVLYYINARTAFFGLLSLLMYVAIYTPLKRKTSFSVFVGAFPGAIPFMLGWVAATGRFGIEPGVLFMVQFFWQFPHFWAIGWMLEEDYNRVGFKMLPSGGANRQTGFLIVLYTLWTVVVSLLPMAPYTGRLSLSVVGGALVVIIGLGMLFYAVQLMREQNKAAARKLMYASIFYITALQLIYVFDKLLIG
ncbi:MAG: heme o synthase [Flavobacteriaceae bacterium]